MNALLLLLFNKYNINDYKSKNNINKTNNKFLFSFSSFSYECIINGKGRDDNYSF
jgi:hypothetical protein